MDLNLTRVFVAVYESRSLTVAAARLYVTQPAVSQALARLRRELDDPLFGRVGRLMEPTPLAVSVYPGFREAVAAIERTLDEVHGFDPRRSNRRFRIALSELGEVGWFPAIYDAVRREAPDARIDVVPVDPGTLAGELSTGSIDLAVTPAPVAAAVPSTVVKTEPYALVTARGNPLAAGAITLDDYAAAAHVGVTGELGRAGLEEALRRVGVSVEPQLAISRIATLPALLARDDRLVATIPESIAAGWTRSWPLVVRPLPFPHAPAQIRLHRRATTQHSAALEWFHAIVLREVSRSSGSFTVLHGEAP